MEATLHIGVAQKSAGLTPALWGLVSLAATLSDKV